MTPATDLEAEVLDKQKYIEETKETMDQNSRKLAEITQGINAIHGGEAPGSYRDNPSLTV